MMKNFMNSGSDSRLAEIIFANRNKEYGAYVLRREEGNVLKKALFIGVAVSFTIAVTPLVISSLTAAPPIENPVPDGPPVWVDPPAEPPVEPEVTPPPAQPAKPVETFVATVPNPVKNTPVETPAPTVDKYDDARAGLVASDGEKPTSEYVPPVTAPSVPAAPVPSPNPQPAADPNAIVESVDIKAGFIGGFDSFRSKVSQNMDISQFEGSGEKLTAKVSFIVEKDGTISGVKASGNDARFNREAERAVRSVRGKWTAAKLKGQSVRSYFNIPITIQFE